MDLLNRLLFRLLLVILFICAVSKTEAQIKTPKEFFGFQPGSDNMLFNYQPLIDYLKYIDERSPRMKMIEVGESPMGKKMYVAFFSSEKNINNLKELQKINKELALNPNLSKPELDEMLHKGKVFIMATLSMHSSEVAPAQSAPLIAYEIATTQNEELLKWLNDVVYMMIPNHNPDGMDMVVDHFNNTKNGKYSGGRMPNVYHKYVGHDNNRDFVTLTQKDTKVIADLYTKSWFPQVMVEKHQMGSTGPRYFVPPNHDPIAENIDEAIWNWTWIFGSNMAKDMTRDGCAGVSQHYLFDDYWPGSTETALWKNVIGLLTEAASVQYAKPIYIEKSELRVIGKGLGEYKKSINMPLPWEGGWWRLGDIVKYELSSTWSLIKTGSIHKKDVLLNRNVLCQKEVAKGKNLPPYYYIVPAKQNDDGALIDMLNLLDEHNISVYKTNKDIIVNGYQVLKGDYVVPLAQPYRAFIKEIMEKQKFPERHYTPGGEMIKPYDITSWSLPMHRGLKSMEVNVKTDAFLSTIDQLKFPLVIHNQAENDYEYLLLPVRRNDSYKLLFMAGQENMQLYRAQEKVMVNGKIIKPGDFLIPFKKKYEKKLNDIISEAIVKPFFIKEKIKDGIVEINLPSIALVETDFHDKDAGWTRFIFDTYHMPFTVLKPGNISKTDLSQYSVIVFPDNRKSLLMSGKYSGRGGGYDIPNVDPQYMRGIGKKGLQNLMGFVNNGGTIVSWGQSAQLFMGVQSIKHRDGKTEEFQLPVKDISSGLRNSGLYCPGSLLNINLKKDHPLTYGMLDKAKVFSRGRPVFSTSIPYFDMDRRIIGSFPEENILASGYVKKQKLLSNKAAMVWIKKGKGQLVLYSFYPQFRASTPGTYKLLFNALFLK